MHTCTDLISKRNATAYRNQRAGAREGNCDSSAAEEASYLLFCGTSAAFWICDVNTLQRALTQALNQILKLILTLTPNPNPYPNLKANANPNLNPDSNPNNNPPPPPPPKRSRKSSEHVDKFVK